MILIVIGTPVWGQKIRHSNYKKIIIKSIVIDNKYLKYSFIIKKIIHNFCLYLNKIYVRNVTYILLF